MSKKILLRADDLGYSEAVNYGIEKAVKTGFVRSVGIMTNMTAAVHGVALLKDENIAFGQHTNFCVGYPLTDPKKIPSLVDENGQFKKSKDYRNSLEDFVVFEEALIEIEAQYQRFVELIDKKPDYLEGHAIASDNFFKALEQFAEEKQVVYSGFPKISEDADHSATEPFIEINQTKVYVTFDSMAKDYDPLLSLKKMIAKPHEDGCDMMVLHPGYLDQYIIDHSSLLLPRVKEVAMLSAKETREYLEKADIQLISYLDFAG